MESQELPNLERRHSGSLGGSAQADSTGSAESAELSIEDSLRATREVIEGNLSAFRDQVSLVQDFMGKAVGELQIVQLEALRRREAALVAEAQAPPEAGTESRSEPEVERSDSAGAMPAAGARPEGRDAAVVDSDGVVEQVVMGQQQAESATEQQARSTDTRAEAGENE